MKVRMIILILFISSWPAMTEVNNLYISRGFIDVDTSYNRVFIQDFYNAKLDKNIRSMGINNEGSSAMFIDSDELVYEYTKYYHLAKYFFPEFKSTLMLGGAGYSYPKDFLNIYPEATIDVIEIDPKVTELAKQYFELKDDLRLKIYHDDGRVYLNKTKKKYDVIFGDAFSSYFSLPYQLTTKEAVKRKFDILNNEGVVVLNIISSINGDKGKFLRAEYATYKSIFPQVYLFPVSDSSNGEDAQNIILVAIKSDKNFDFKSNDIEIDNYLQHIWSGEVINDMPILTDDYAPVDSYISSLL